VWRLFSDRLPSRAHALAPAGELKPNATDFVRGLVKCRSLAKELLFCMLWLVKLQIACFAFEQEVEISEDIKIDAVVEDCKEQQR